jgi:tetratricopeptide (TPR) repeat protein
MALQHQNDNITFMKQIYIIFVLTISVFIQVKAQDSLTVKESQALRYISREAVEMRYLELLQEIADSRNDQVIVKSLIDSSIYSNRRKRFSDEKVTIENDLDPTRTLSGVASDLSIKTYLQNFDLYYPKSEDRSSISFNNFKVSNVKKGEMIYVKVYFTSYLNKRSKAHSEIDFTPLGRVAEVKLEKKTDRWTAYIASIRYYNSNDTLNDQIGDLPIKNDAINGVANTALSDSLDPDIAASIEEEKVSKQTYIKIIQQGDEAIKMENYVEALRLYNSAGELRPYETIHLVRIKNTNDKKILAEKTKDVLYDETIKLATTAKNKRKYNDAVDLYVRAEELKPENGPKLLAQRQEIQNIKEKIDIQNEKFNTGEYKTVINNYDKLIKQNKTISDYFLGRAKAYDRQDNFKQALLDYDQAITLDGNNLEAIRLKAEMHVRKNKLPEAIGIYNRYLGIDKQTAEIYLDVANVRLMSNNQIDAIAILNEGIKNMPKDSANDLHKLYLKKGVIQYEKKDFKGATESLTTSINNFNSDPYPYFYRGQSQIYLNNVNNAANDFDNARKLDLDSSNITIVNVYADQFFNRAEQRFSELKIDSSITLIDAAISINPLKSTFFFRKGDYLYAQKKYSESLPPYTQSIALNANYIDALYKRASAFYQLERYREAIIDFNSASQLNPKLYLAQKGIGDSYFKLKEYPNAINNLERAKATINSIKNAENDAAMYSDLCNVLGKSYYEEKNYEKSLSNLETAIRKNPSFAEAHFNRGLSYFYSGQNDKALKDFSNANNFKKGIPQWNYFLAKSQQTSRDYSNATTNYSTAIASDTFSLKQDALYNRGICYYQEANYSSALKDYLSLDESTIIQTSPKYHIELGNIYLNNSQADSALVAFEKVIEKDAKNLQALTGKATALFSKSKADESLAVVENIYQNKLTRIKDFENNKLLAGLFNTPKYKELKKKYR